MKKNPIKSAPWYPTAMAACIAVVLYVLLTRFPGIWAGVRTFFGYFKPLILGCVIAYIVNPLAKLLYRLLHGVKRDPVRTLLANAMAFIILVLFLVFALLILVPQLAASVQTFSRNLDRSIATVNAMLENWGLSKTALDLSSVVSSSESLLDAISRFIRDHIDSVLATSANAGKLLFQWGIAFILSIYLLGGKQKLTWELRRLLRAAVGERRYDGVSVFLHKCNGIFNRYIVFNLIDSLIIGVANAIFMAIAGMQYVGLTSFVVAVTNLVPTFGPVIGAVIGGFVLFMVKPMHALLFLIFTLVLQICDGYVIKPRLFGNSLGVSGLWILVGVIVGGNMFGVVGILLAIPGVAILDLIYGTYLLPWLERRSAAGKKEL